MRRSAHRRGAGERLRHWLAVGLVCALGVAAITLAGFGSFTHTSDNDAQVDAGLPVPTHPAPLTPRPRTGPSAVQIALTHVPKSTTTDERSLDAAMDRWMKAAGPASGALVYDMDSKAPLYADRPTVRRPPASVEKIFTTVSLMRILGPSARLHTAVLGSGDLRHGVWHGNLYLHGGGDPTFGDAGFDRTWYGGAGSTASELVAQLRRMRIRRVTGWVYGDESLFDDRRGGLITNYAPDTPDFGGWLSALTYDHGSALKHLGPAQFATREFTITMRGAGITARASKHTATTPQDAKLLAEVNSPPLSVMTRLMDVPSDDLFAEMFTKQLGVLFGTGGTISSGARVIQGTIASSYGVHPTILDGSGLSRDDRTSPLEIVDLLRELWHTPIGNELSASLPIVGKQGTVQTIGLKTAAVGRCIAKTGTLDDVTNLAGYCHAKDGHTLAFGLFVDGPPNWTALTLESDMVGAIARY
ncbi:MAG TPA: D-alanyl-D-alanine carboxypeptidase [Solirubrobacteraceae bacterium]|nr:D-alanyl-D-alanine carboxypeptidase [Solirubrobacteraceae bacterium]